MIRRSRNGVPGWTEDASTAPRALSVASPFARTLTREIALNASTEAQSGGRGGSGGGRRGKGAESARSLLSDDELRDVEAQFCDGITAAQVVDIFVTRGHRFSEATFRKYVQQGLLPRSRRVGRKGKHRGSLGVYPAKTVRRVNSIKRLMQANYTIEEIQQQFLRFTDVIENLEESIDEIFAHLADELQSDRFDAKSRRALKKDLSEAHKSAADLMRRLESLSRRVSSARGDRYRSTGAAGSAEELL